jgi:hypothetical protein
MAENSAIEVDLQLVLLLVSLELMHEDAERQDKSASQARDHVGHHATTLWAIAAAFPDRHAQCARDRGAFSRITYSMFRFASVSAAARPAGPAADNDDGSLEQASLIQRPVAGSLRDQLLDHQVQQDICVV